MWSIGMYRGTSPFRLVPCPANPVLHPGMVSDAAAEFVADPFMVYFGDTWFLFCEVFNGFSWKGEIGLAESLDGLSWQYRRIVLKERFHLSYPCVFFWRDAFYMIPETFAAGSVRLYRADPFPLNWSYLGNLLEGAHADPTFIDHDGYCYLFACRKPFQQETLLLYCSEAPAGPWREHPCSPIVTRDNRRARPAGRVITWRGYLYRFAQDCYPLYGSSVRAFQILELTPTTYRERECPDTVLGGSGQGWNAARMHHLDAHAYGGQLLACVDGFDRYERGTMP